MSTIDQQKKITCRVCGAEFYPGEKWQIDKKKLLLAEGVDAHRFLIYACKAYGKLDVQVIDFGGIKELNLFLKNLIQDNSFSQVETLVIARDAETSVNSAISSIQNSLRDLGLVLPVPTRPFEWQPNSSIKVAFMLFPGIDGTGQCRTGTLEDLCLLTIANDPLLNCVEGFIQCAQANQQNTDRIVHLWKSKLYTYLAGKDDHAGKRLSQAAKENVFSWEHAAMRPFKSIIQAM